MDGADHHELLRMYRLMIRIRRFEEKVTELFMEGLVPGTIHLCTGQEATAVGVMSCLRADDRIMLTHRPHGHALAKGMDPKRLMAEILGKAEGCAGGVGGSMHIVDIEHGIMPSIPIVGAGIPIAVGIAYAFKCLGSSNISVSFFGDGATNIGAFHEALNLAAIWTLPVVFVCENNLYAVSTRIDSVTRAATLAEKARSYGVASTTVDGNDVVAVREMASVAVTRARSGEGPSFIECLTYRHGGHSRTDPGTYRTDEEVDQWKARDPIQRCRRSLLWDNSMVEGEVLRIEEEEARVAEEAAQFAKVSGEPDPHSSLPSAFADEVMS